MQYSLLNLFSFDYWFNLHPVLFINDFAFKFFITLSILFLIVGVVGFIYTKKVSIDKFKKYFIKSISNTFIIFSIILFIWIFFRYQNVYVLSMRIWIVVTLAWFIYKIYIIYNDYTYKLKKKDELKSIKSEIYKYMPTKKKKKG